MQTVHSPSTRGESTPTNRQVKKIDVFAMVLDPQVKPEATRAEKLTRLRIRREERARAAALAEFMRLADQD